MHRFSIWLQGSGAQIHWWWCTGVAAPRHVRSSQTGGSNPCLLHWQEGS